MSPQTCLKHFRNECTVKLYIGSFASHASLLRNSQVARLSVNTAMIAIGHVLFRISAGGISFRNTPLVTTIM